jgi:hypothetical protein
MALSLINLVINKYTSYFPTLLEHCGTQASSRKGPWPALQKKVEDHLSRSVVFNLCYAYPRWYTKTCKIKKKTNVKEAQSSH